MKPIASVVLLLLVLAVYSVKADFEDDYETGEDHDLSTTTTTTTPAPSDKPIIQPVETDEFETFVVTFKY